MLTKAMSSTPTIRESGDFQSSQTRVVPSQLKKIISTSQSWTTPTINHPTTIPLTKNSPHSMETCTTTPNSWSPTRLQPSLVFSATTSRKIPYPTKNTNNYGKNANSNDTTTRAEEPVLDVEAAVSEAEHVSATKNKKNPSIQTN
jgi:hypothetical protein